MLDNEYYSYHRYPSHKVFNFQSHASKDDIEEYYATTNMLPTRIGPTRILSRT